MEYRDIRSRIKSLGVSSKYIIKLIYIEKGERISEAQFSGAINKASGLRQPREVQIVKLAEAILDKLEAERRKD